MRHPAAQEHLQINNILNSFLRRAFFYKQNVHPIPQSTRRIGEGSFTEATSPLHSIISSLAQSGSMLVANSI